MLWYAYGDDLNTMFAIPLEHVFKILEDNRQGIIPERLEDYVVEREKKQEFYVSPEQEELTRFDDE